jgi:hypothetical protein
MIRLILGVLVFVLLVLAVAAARDLARRSARPFLVPAGPREDPMPDALRNVAYVLLLILLIGVATGFLGA